MHIEEILSMMSKQGLRITEQRKTLIQLFNDAEGYLTAKDVYDEMSKKYSGLSFDTVYRNLRVLSEMAVLEQFMLEEGVKFKLRCGEHEHHHHLICLECEKTLPLVFCPMDFVDQIPDGFQPVKHKFEVYGYCKDCRQPQELKVGKQDASEIV